MPRRRKRRQSKGRSRPAPRREWIGGRLSPPMFIHDREQPYRPELVIWMASSGLVVGQEAVAPEDAEGAVARVLLDAMEHPLAGPKHRPDAIRVANHSLAAEVRAAVGGAIPITVAPTPELDALLESLVEWMHEADEQDESYLEGGRIPPETVAELFTAAEILYRAAPWKVVFDSQVLRMDIPALGVEGACVSIIGNLGESLGVLVFPSLDGYKAFCQAASEPFFKERKRFDFGTHWLALDFERGADIPASMRREVASHAWPVAEADAYPRVLCIERDGASRPLAPRDLKIATACAASLCPFFGAHRDRFENDPSDAVCESYSLPPHDVEVRLTFPYQTFPHFDVDGEPMRRPPPARQGRTRPGRNDPCPCGSGRKYKKCCLPRDEKTGSVQRRCKALHALDNSLTYELMEFAAARFGSALRDSGKDFADVAEVLELSPHWSVYHFRIGGATVLEHYLEERGRRLSPAESAWLEAQAAAWLSVWEVVTVEPGVSVTVRDLLSHEERCVHETMASTTLAARDALLARIVDHDGDSLLCGVHPRPLPPSVAAEVVRRARGRLRRKRAVPVDRLREEAFGRYLIRRWEEAVTELDELSEFLPELANTDGDPLLSTVDHFRIAPGARPAVEARLAALDGVEPPVAGEDPSYVFLRSGNTRHASWENTVIGLARVSDTTLRLETNSRERADALRERVESACGDRIRHRAREHADPLSDMAVSDLPDPASEPLTPVPEQLVLEFKQRHYADWPDQPLPALDGKTPREAVRTAEGRAAVDTLLKDMENHEQRSQGGAAFDFSEIRRELRLE